MYANYAIWGGGSCGPDDDFFPVGVGISNRKGQVLVESDSTA